MFAFEYIKNTEQIFVFQEGKFMEIARASAVKGILRSSPEPGCITENKLFHTVKCTLQEGNKFQ